MIEIGEKDLGRQRIFNEVNQFIATMNFDKTLVISLSDEAEKIWESEDNKIAQDEMGGQIVTEFSRPDLSSMIVTDQKQRPVLLINRLQGGGWDGLSVDPRLRDEASQVISKALDELN